MSEQTGPRERSPRDTQNPRVPAPVHYPEPRSRGMGASALGLIALGVVAGVVGAVALGPALGTQFRSQSAPARSVTAPNAAPATVPEAEGTPTVSINPAGSAGTSASSSLPGVPSGSPGDSSFSPNGAGSPTEGAAGTTPGLATDPLRTRRRQPHEQMGPPLPPELAAERARERLKQLGLTPPSDLLAPMKPDDPRLRGLEGNISPLDPKTPSPHLSANPPGSASDPLLREGETPPPALKPRSAEPSPLVTAPDLPAPDPIAPGGPVATAPPVSVPVAPAGSGATASSGSALPTPNTTLRKPKPAPTAASGKYRYRVRVGQFATEGAAHKFRRQMFQATGRGAEVVPDGEGFRLEVGAYGDAVAAERVADELRAQSYTPDVLEPKSGVARKE